MEPGERMLLWCDGGPSIGRAVAYPPPLEIEVDGGTYVLVDAGAIEHWHYAFVECHGTQSSAGEVPRAAGSSISPRASRSRAARGV
jgi:hypothetical protein